MFFILSHNSLERSPDDTVGDLKKLIAAQTGLEAYDLYLSRGVYIIASYAYKAHRSQRLLTEILTQVHGLRR